MTVKQCITPMKIALVITLFYSATACNFNKEKKGIVDDSVEYKNARSIPVLKIPTDIQK